jgi:hypothetical protein
MSTQTIELKIPIEIVPDNEAVLASERSGPTVMQITPIEIFRRIEGKICRQITFRVAFEPQNKSRRKQPLRYSLDPHAFGRPDSELTVKVPQS